MPIAITDTHRELESVARSFLENAEARAEARALLDAPDEELPAFWDDLVDLGWLGLHLPEDVGGSGYGLPELVVVLQELGRAVAPGPFLPDRAGVGGDRDRGHRRAAGRAPALPTAPADALGLERPAALRRVGDGGSCSAPASPTCSCSSPATTSSWSIATRAGVTVDGGRQPRPDPPQRRGALRPRGRARRSACCAARHAPRSTSHACSYRPRPPVARRSASTAPPSTPRSAQQFGRVIAMFQAVKHHCANMLVASELATAAVWDAARAAASGGDQFSLAAAVAAVQAIPAFLHNAQLNIQVHGGIGFTWEHDGHMLLRRAATLVALFDSDAAARGGHRAAAGGHARASSASTSRPKPRSCGRRPAPSPEEIAALDAARAAHAS